MALGNCPECNHKVARSATFCPQCGNTKFSVKMGIQKLELCGEWHFEAGSCEGGWVRGRRGGFKCDACNGTGVISKEYYIDVRDEVNINEIKSRVEKHNKEILNFARDQRWKVEHS